ncbi:very short patch repair endonuclease [Fusibacter sp. JL216-2]|uniref:very short patch repair endonuclease n=1 Tax=Fusibacter sp. JL216-2 TaxID=3071453 RepID=UPI003D32FDFB
MTDKITKPQRSYNMSRIRSKNTKPEERVRKYLFSKGLRYRKNDKRYPGKPDIVLPKYQTVVLVNGCFWHMHEGCKYSSMPKSNTEYWKKKLVNNKDRDERVISELESLGFTVLVVWECEIKEDFDEAMINFIRKLLAVNTRNYDIINC